MVYLFVCVSAGAEGTLGVITEVVIKLRQRPEYLAAVRVCFPSVADAAAACHSTRAVSG